MDLRTLFHYATDQMVQPSPVYVSCDSSRCCYVAALANQWGDGGLRSLLVDSVGYAINSIDLMVSGKQYHRAASRWFMKL